MSHEIKTPIDVDTVRKLRTGDAVCLSGIIFTGRDVFHKYLVSPTAGKLPFSLNGAVIYHCGPIVIKEDGKWKITAAGPTTSARTGIYIPSILSSYRIRGFIGKGGLDMECAKAFKKEGCAYFSAAGGCAQVLAEAIVRVRNVYFLEEFGSPEAVWELEVRKFPLTVTMDSNGGNLHSEVERLSSERLLKLA